MKLVHRVIAMESLQLMTKVWQAYIKVVTENDQATSLSSHKAVLASLNMLGSAEAAEAVHHAWWALLRATQDGDEWQQVCDAFEELFTFFNQL